MSGNVIIKLWLVVVAVFTALVVAATVRPVRAADDKSEAVLDRAFDVCVKMGGDKLVCTMKHSSESNATLLAQILVDGCTHEKATRSWGWIQMYSSCPKTLPYIKQRWGY